MSRLHHFWSHILIYIKVLISSAKHFFLEALNPVVYAEGKKHYDEITFRNIQI